MNTLSIKQSISQALAAIALVVLPANMAFAAEDAGGGIMSLVPLVLIMVIFWVLLIRPQQKRMKEHAEALNALKKGDKIITGGGILGRIMQIKDNVVTVEITDGVSVRVKQDTIAGLQESPKPKEKTSEKKTKAGK